MPRSRSVRLIAAVCCIACIGCDQFAAVGIRDPERATAGAPARPDGGGAGDGADHDAATPTDGGSNDAGPANDAGAIDHAGAQCAPVAVTDCNPVTNEGCPASLMMQCAVNHAAVLTGYCIFFSGPPPAFGDACLNTVVTESCPPTSTCVVDRCRELCFCDSDCEAGQCCAEPLEATGFKVCGDC
jgi:hypothetical protein